MSTVGIVLISLLAGILICLLISTCAYLLWMQHQLRQSLAASITASHDAANSLGLLKTSIEGMLGSHISAMRAEVAKINGDRLAQASANAIAASQRIEKAAIAIGDLVSALLSEETLAEKRLTGTDLKPLDFAPNPTGERYATQSRTALQDAEHGDQSDLADEAGAETEPV